MDGLLGQSTGWENDGKTMEDYHWLFHGKYHGIW